MVHTIIKMFKKIIVCVLEFFILLRVWYLKLRLVVTASYMYEVTLGMTSVFNSRHPEIRPESWKKILVQYIITDTIISVFAAFYVLEWWKFLPALIGVHVSLKLTGVQSSHVSWCMKMQRSFSISNHHVFWFLRLLLKLLL